MSVMNNETELPGLLQSKNPAPKQASLNLIQYAGFFLLCFFVVALLASFVVSQNTQNGLIENWALRTNIDSGLSTNEQTSAFSWPIRSLIVTFHQIGLVVGLGAAFFLDLYLTQFLYNRRVSQQTLEISNFGSRIVAIGLAALWISGFAILAYYYFAAPELLSNPKIWGKFFIVVMLTINGMLIHRYALPALAESEGKTILEGDFSIVVKTHLPVLAISIVSWTSAFILGAFKELNNVVSSGTIILAYLAVLAITYIVLVAGCWLVVEQRNRQHFSAQH